MNQESNTRKTRERTGADWSGQSGQSGHGADSDGATVETIITAEARH